MDRLEDKIDALNEKHTNLHVEVSAGFAKYNELLEKHIEGVEQNRESIRLLTDHVSRVKGIVSFLKFFGAPAALAAIILTILDKLKII